jgi:hypothetical protein
MRDERRHRYGEHYTPHAVGSLLAALAVRSAEDLVLDPSCGDGRLLEHALKIKRALASNHLASKLETQVFGVERAESAVKQARRTGALVAVANFFDIEPGSNLDPSTPLPRAFDAIVGNPPYIRQEIIGSSGKRTIEASLERDRAASPELFWPRWSGRSDIYVYFFAHSIRFLKERGRMVLLTASSWLDAGYGAALRQFLLHNFKVIAVIESKAESFFADASINTCITVLERELDPVSRNANQIRFVRIERPLIEVLDGGGNPSLEEPSIAFARSVLDTSTTCAFDSHRIRIVSHADLLAMDKGSGWGRYLRAEDVFFKVIERGNSRLQSLSQMASVRFGVKTGANDFFYVREVGREKSRKRLLALSDIASVRRGITTGANEFFYLNNDASKDGRASDSNGNHSNHRPSDRSLCVVRDADDNRLEIEANLLTPVVFSLKQIAGITLSRVDTRRLLFNCPLDSNELIGTKAYKYILKGEQAGFHLRPTCANREPWYSVARGIKPAPLIFPSKVGERWLVAVNKAKVFEDKKLYGVFPSQGVSVLVLAALLNSTWARYYAEITCRQMTGAQAIADIDVAVAEQILLPDPRKFSPSDRKKLEAAVLAISERSIVSIFEEVNDADRRRLDSLVLETIGFGNKRERDSVLDELYDAVSGLVRDRLSKGTKGKNKVIEIDI